VIQSLLSYDTVEIVHNASINRGFDMQALGFKLTLLKVFLLEAFSANSPDVDFSLEATKSTQ
jgi:hypothetical protein